MTEQQPKSKEGKWVTLRISKQDHEKWREIQKTTYSEDVEQSLPLYKEISRLLKLYEQQTEEKGVDK